MIVSHLFGCFESTHQIHVGNAGAPARTIGNAGEGARAPCIIAGNAGEGARAPRVSTGAV